NDSGIEEAPAAVTKPETKPAATGWGGLFRGTAAAQKAVVVSLPPTNNSSETSPPATAAWKSQQRPVPPEQDRELAAIGDALRRVAAQLGVAKAPAPLQPRGLNNSGNFCYINAILQMLFLCPPFHAFFRALGQQCQSFSSGTAWWSCSPTTARRQSPKLTSGQPYTPHQAYQLPWHGASGRSREDAEEFLSHLLNSLHDELAKATGDGSSHSNGQANGDKTAQAEADAETDVANEWQCVGPKNRSAVTRTCQSATGTIVSELFGGQLRHQLVRSNRPPTANLQPFFVLPLDIDLPD
uniref:ubiquitinyl hydrolase 1 n=1 Tax=Macrostomum lignano TaxID=282301 RepID=A0A1I8FHU0_9PLAT